MDAVEKALSLCNMVCPQENEDGFQLSKHSHILIPPGTRITIFVNEDPNDPSSDCYLEEVFTVGHQDIGAVLTESISTKKLD